MRRQRGEWVGRVRWNRVRWRGVTSGGRRWARGGSTARELPNALHRKASQRGFDFVFMLLCMIFNQFYLSIRLEYLDLLLVKSSATN